MVELVAQHSWCPKIQAAVNPSETEFDRMARGHMVLGPPQSGSNRYPLKPCFAAPRTARDDTTCGTEAQLARCKTRSPRRFIFYTTRVRVETCMTSDGQGGQQGLLVRTRFRTRTPEPWVKTRAPRPPPAAARIVPASTLHALAIPESTAS